MHFKRATLVSVLVHVGLFALLLSGFDGPLKRMSSPPIPVLASLVVKRPVNKDILPKKPKLPASPPINSADVGEKKEIPKAVTPKVKIAKVNPIKNQDTYLKALSSLSQNFATDLAKESEVSDTDTDAETDSYFDRVYSLIKASFVVPPHVNGPLGRTLQATVRIYLASDGGLYKLDLVTPSGDEHFDKAIVDGTKRVGNFGAVPDNLRKIVWEKGILVDLCPFTCSEN